MDRPLRSLLAAVVVTGAVALAAGCGSSSSSSADATTTSTPPAATTAPATTAPATTAPATTPAPPATTGDAAAGETVFSTTCTGCHMNNGKDAGGIGPKLAGTGLDASTIRNQVINGGGPMPAGLVSGTDLDNVTAYVLSLQ